MKNFLLASSLLCAGLIALSLRLPVNDSYIEKDPDNCLDDLEVPKRFTPDGNDTNDVFMINFPCPPESFEVQIFDRFEKRVFVDKNGNVEWNGLDLENKPCDSGIYSWKLAYMYHMRYVERQGQLLLLR